MVPACAIDQVHRRVLLVRNAETLPRLIRARGRTRREARKGAACKVGTCPFCHRRVLPLYSSELRRGSNLGGNCTDRRPSTSLAVLMSTASKTAMREQIETGTDVVRSKGGGRIGFDSSKFATPFHASHQGDVHLTLAGNLRAVQLLPLSWVEVDDALEIAGKSTSERPE